MPVDLKSIETLASQLTDEDLSSCLEELLSWSYGMPGTSVGNKLTVLAEKINRDLNLGQGHYSTGLTMALRLATDAVREEVGLRWLKARKP